MLDHAQLKARPKATESQISNIKQWFKNQRFKNANETAIQYREIQFVDKNEDLIPVNPKTKTLLHKLIDNLKSYPLCALSRIRDVCSSVSLFSIPHTDCYQMNGRVEESSVDVEIDTTVYYNKSAISQVDFFKAAAILVATLIVSLGCLQYVPTEVSLGEVLCAAIGGFLGLALSLTLLLMTEWQPLVALACAASYVICVVAVMQAGT